MRSLAGLPAGLGLAALLSHFGLSEGLADLLMILIVVAAAIFALGMLFVPEGHPTSTLASYLKL